MRLRLFLAFCAVGLLLLQAQEPIQRTLLQKAPVTDLPGWECRTYLIEYGPGVRAPLHHHTVAGLGYVLEGTVSSAFANQQPVVYRAGSSFLDPAGLPHTISENVSTTEPLRLLITYTVRQDQPVTVTP